MSLLDGDARVAVSSVLNRDVKQYGKKYMFDGNDDTCWNSDQVRFCWLVNFLASGFFAKEFSNYRNNVFSI